MDARMEAVLSAAGVNVPEDSVEVLRDGSPWYVLRASLSEDARHASVILKTCALTSREPEITASLSGVLECVPRVLRVGGGSGFRVMMLEDFGRRGLYECATPETYMEAVKVLGGIHRRFEGDSEQCTGIAGLVPPRGLTEWPASLQLIPTYGRKEWASTLAAAARLTSMRFADGTYRGTISRGARRLPDSLKCLLRRSLDMLDDTWGCGLTMPSTLVHGDFHEGNILLRDGEGSPKFGLIDWGDARRDCGLIDLVSLIDVAHRMKAVKLDEEQVLSWYLAVRNGSSALVTPEVQAEWNLAWVLRAWMELRWFADSGEDFGERADREIGIIGARLTALPISWALE